MPRKADGAAANELTETVLSDLKQRDWIPIEEYAVKFSMTMARVSRTLGERYRTITLERDARGRQCARYHPHLRT